MVTHTKIYIPSSYLPEFNGSAVRVGFTGSYIYLRPWILIKTFWSVSVSVGSRKYPQGVLYPVIVRI